MFLGNDANFRMVRKKVSSETADPTLSAGWSYFCEITKYHDIVAKAGEQKKEVSCNRFHSHSHTNIVYLAVNVR